MPGSEIKLTPNNTALHALVVAISLFAGLWLHLQAGLTLPLPVGDEVVFYYPALSLVESGHLQSNHLHEGRALFWMPPGYMVMLAGWFELVGASLAKARWLSFVLASIAYLLFARLFQKWNLGLAGLILLSVCMLSRHWVVMANFTRMEALELCLWGLGLLSLAKSNRWATLSWFLLSVSVHPNGVYFCGFWVGHQLISHYSSTGSSTKDSKPFYQNLIHILPGLVAAVAYAIYIFSNWPDFQSDWQYQFSTRQTGGVALLLFRPDVMAFLAMWGVCAWLVYANRSLRTYTLPLAVAGTFWLMRLLGQGWSYGIFNILAVTFTAAIALKVVEGQFFSSWANARLRSVLTVFGMAMMVVALVGAKVYSVPGMWRTYEWQGMLPEAAFPSPYLTEGDERAVQDKLQEAGQAFAARNGRLAQVYFLPAGDGILAGNERPSIWTNILPTFDGRMPDLILWHRSARGTFFDVTPEEIGTVCDVDTLRPFYTRPFGDGELIDRWYLIDLKGKPAPFLQSQSSNKTH